MILAGRQLISRAYWGGIDSGVALGLVPRIGPQPIAKGLTTKTEPNLSKISIAWLERAVAAGYRHAAHMAADHNLDALRHRADFKELLERLRAAKPK